MTSPQVKADAVKAALSSASTCTSATVTGLSEILLKDSVIKHPENEDASKAKATGRPARRPISSKIQKGNKRGRKVLLDEKERPNQVLSSKEKEILATEVVNVTLKILSNLTKSTRPLQEDASQEFKATRPALQNTNSISRSPLLPRSLNRVSSSPTVLVREKRTSSSFPSCSPGCRAIAECSRIAFSYLRTSSTSSTKSTPLQLEIGMSALVGKLILLGLNDLALRELKILKRRLDSRASHQNISGKHANTMNIEVVDLFGFVEVPDNIPELALAVATQLHALKLLTTIKTPKIIAAVLPRLSPTYPTSPIQLLLRQAEDVTQVAKAMKQLENVTQMILSVTPSISCSADAATLSSTSDVDPSIALRLQTVAFQYRQSSWKLRESAEDTGKDVIEPFSRCLAAFSRRCQGGVSEKYEIAKVCVQALKIVPKWGRFIQDIKSPMLRIYKLLGCMAQEAEEMNDANTWMETLHLQLIRIGAANVLCCAAAARLCSLKLREKRSYQDAEALLMSILDSLQGPLRGDTTDLEELLTDISHLRRVTISVLFEKKLNAVQDQHEPLPDGMRQMCESLVFLCLRVSLRYLGKRPDDTSAPRVVLLFEQRRQSLQKSAFHNIDSVLFLIKALQAENRLTWDLLDSALQDCLALLDGITRSNAQSSKDSSDCETSYHVKISHLYYAQHLNLLRDSQDSKDTLHLRALRRSIDSVRMRSAIEKNAVLYTSKLERMVEVLKKLGRHDEARDIILHLRDELVAKNVMAIVSKAAETMPIRHTMDQNEDTLRLARLIESYIKLEMRKPSVKGRELIFYDSTWPISGRASLLEYSVEILSHRKSEVQAMLVCIFKVLLDLYHPKSYPIRRLRVINSILRLSPEHRYDLVKDLKTSIALASLDTVVKESEDLGLTSYLTHLHGVASITLELLEDYPRTELILPHLSSISSILEGCIDFSVICSKIDNVSAFLSHLGSIADFLDMKGSRKSRIAVLRMITKVLELKNHFSSPDDIILSHVTLAMQYLELGFSGKASLSLDKALTRTTLNGASSLALLQVHVSYAEYYLVIGNMERCEEALSRVQVILAKEDFKSMSVLLDRNQRTCILTNALRVHSLFALSSGDLRSALLHARQGLRAISQAWLSLERSPCPNPPLEEEQIEASSVDAMHFTVSATVKPLAALIQEKSPGQTAWILAKPLFRSLRHLARVYSTHGMFQETLYYEEQAHRVARLTDSITRLAEALTSLGGIWLQAGSLDKAAEQLNQATDLCLSSQVNQASALLRCHLATLYGMQGNQQSQMGAYEEGRMILENLVDPNYIQSLDSVDDDASILAKEMSRLDISIGQANPPRRGPAAGRRAANKASATRKLRESNKKATVKDKSSVSEECCDISALRGFLLRQKACALMHWKHWDEANSVLSDAEKYVRNKPDLIDQKMCLAKALFLGSIEQMTEDPVYSVLQDSTISFPAITGANKLQNYSQTKTSGSKASPQRRIQANSSRRPKISSLSPFDKLKQAFELLTEAHLIALPISSTGNMYRVSSLLHATSILLSTFPGSIKAKGTIQSGVATSAIEMTRSLAIEKERAAVTIDNGYSNSNGSNPEWPGLLSANTKNVAIGSTADSTRFQEEYIDIIPPTWTVMSMALSEDQQEICITKMQANSSPFVLRLPLGRNYSRDADEQIFDFAQGKKELLEIIDLANFSAHGAREITGKEAKTAWWAERDALDTRLKELLQNIENVWLGGFKGIFSQSPKKHELLTRFHKSFQDILDKYLPSRQKMGSKGTAPRITLDTHVLELFIGLGDWSTEASDLDEPLTDLLYFVVDILQFHGERNAYDEIDFDSMVLDTQDALQKYHLTARSVTSEGIDRHTILILDKFLHAFPWESLPCMDGLPISRLPSLGCLRDRLLKQRRAGNPETHTGCYIDRENGSYVLNPGGDLKSTQNAFKDDLQALQTWDGYIQQEPSESEIKQALETKDLFLYFGHGSGAQYIRAKTIKKLDRCAVTVLMGCSSGALTSAGEFEPYGPPANYMLAGSAALVATLWDVTDKDIDRFAKSTFEHWGLFHRPERKSGKEKGRKQDGVDEKQRSLVEAVATGRKACNFRYLTAAAVCVYGIPVYFK